MDARARIVLVDDDPSILRLVEMVLEELPVALVPCTSVAEGLAALRAAPAQLVITDLMMPGETGFDLLRALAAEPALRGGATLAVFSAGLNAETAADLAALGVQVQIPKPISVLALEAEVRRVLDGVVTPPAARPAPPPASRADVVRDQFAGDEVLYGTFRSGCIERFPDDLRQGDAALASGDAATLRRIAHSLKGVLRLLGEDGAAERALAVENSADAGRLDLAAAPWRELKAAVAALTA
jgi:CheY-like chemotaxis protein